MKTFPLLVVLLANAVGAAEPAVLAAESAAVARRLDDLAKKEAAAKAKPSDAAWTEIVNELQTILNVHSNELVPVTPSRSVAARWVCHARLSLLGPAGLKIYRAAAEAPARKIFDEARDRRDVAALRRVVEESFCTRAAEAALDLLGDLAFERGDFVMAERWWQMLAPLEQAGDDQSPTLRFPDPEIDTARTQAKQLLARWYAGGGARQEEWDSAFQAFRARHAEADGHLAGARGVYWKRLETIRKSEPQPTLPPAFSGTGWPTFGGDPSRNHILPAETLAPPRLAQLLKEGEHRIYSLETGERLETLPPDPPGSGVNPTEFRRSLAFHPIIVGRQVVVADARRVTAYGLDTDRSVVWYDLARFGHGEKLNMKLPAPVDSAYTLSAGPGCVLTRLGAADVRFDREPRENASFLVCLNLLPDETGNRVRWLATPGTPGVQAVFKGAPLVVGRHAYIAVTRFERNRAITAIHCYGLDGRGFVLPRWRQDVSSGMGLLPGETPTRLHLLTAAGPNIVYCTHYGAVVALDAATGRTAWGIRYRRRDEDSEPRRPDQCPCVFADGKLYVAPADSEQLLCLDPLTGQSIWTREGIDVVQVIGVAKGRLVFATSTPSAGLRAVDASDGDNRGGWFRTGRDSQPIYTCGRGRLCGDFILWPTLNHVYAVNAEDGDEAIHSTLLDKLPPGNLIAGGGAVAVADRKYLHVFVPARPPTEARPGPMSWTDGEAKTYATAARRIFDPPLSAKALRSPLERAWQETLTPGSRCLIPDSDTVIAVEPDRVSRRAANDGRMLWQRAEVTRATWAGRHNETVILGSSRRVVAVNAGDGELVWEHSSGSRLSAFQLAAGRLFFLEGERRLVALDTASGRRLWARDAPGAFLLPPDVPGRFAPDFEAGPATVRLSDPDWCLDARTGAARFERPPEAVDGIFDCDPSTGRPLWRHVPAQPTTLTGEPCQRCTLTAGSRRLTLLIVPRNHGTALELLDGGKPRWSVPPILNAADAWPAGISHDDDNLYLVSAGTLTAVALTDGRTAWSRPVGGSSGVWQTQAAGDYVAVFPARARKIAIPVPMTRGRLECRLALDPEERLGAGVPILLCERKTGRLAQRLNLEASTPRLTCCGREAASEGPVVRTTGKGLLVALNERIWCFH